VTGDPNLIDQYRRIHATSVYGSTSIKNLRFLGPEIKILRPQSILDYGCGPSRLLEALDLGYRAELLRYDPAIPQYSKLPAAKVDLLINVDVLEHIEERDLDSVLAEMASLCRNAIIIIDTKKAAAILPDGRNAHVTLRPHVWWKERLLRHFSSLHPIVTARSSRAGFRTWERNGVQTLRYKWMRAQESTRYFVARIAGNRPGD
jgi:hypothetical protein